MNVPKLSNFSKGDIMENNKIKFDVLNKEEADIVRAVIDDKFSSIEDVDDKVSYWQSALKEIVKRKPIHLKL
jgi:uncharacterized lipoprotein YehR (DUF1307 family)